MVASYSIFNPSFKSTMAADIQKIKNDPSNKTDGNTNGDCVTKEEITRAIQDGTLKGDAKGGWQDVLNHYSQIDVPVASAGGRGGGDDLINIKDISAFNGLGYSA